MENIYQPPSADVETKNKEAGGSGGAVKVYSPTQVACGTLGGPVGLVYFLAVNFSALADESSKNKTLLWGSLSIVALICLLPFLPESVPNLPFTVAYIVIARSISSKYQMTKDAIVESNVHEFQSNWRVFGFSLICFICSVIVIIIPLMLLAYLGIWDAE